MSDSMKELLAKRATAEPPEFAIIRAYISQHFGLSPQLSLSNKSIIIGMPNSAAAGSLRLVLHELQDLCGKKNKLMIRIV